MRPAETSKNSAISAEPGAIARWLRTRLFEISVLLWSAPFAVLIMTYFQIRRPPHHVRIALRLWSSGFITLARICVGVRYRVKGHESVPDQPVIFACNHQSYWESIALTALIPHINVISKRGAMRFPVFGWGLKHAPMIPVDREMPGTNLRRILRQSKASLQEGRSILIFPEGHRVKKGETTEFERGVELLYKACDVPLVPIVQNAGPCWPPGWQPKHPGLVTLRFLDPIAPGLAPEVFMTQLEETLNTEKERI